MSDETSDSSGKSKIAKIGAGTLAGLASIASVGLVSLNARRDMYDDINNVPAIHAKIDAPPISDADVLAKVFESIHDIAESVADAKKRKDEQKLQMNIGGTSYMSDMTIRDPDAMIRFATEIDGYCEAMQNVCKALQSDLSSASPMMRDEKSKKAMQKIETLAGDLISGLPEAKDAAEKLRAAAKPLIEAQSISF